jgi:TatD DNase family protein
MEILLMKIFDTHAHYDDRWFDEDREALIGSLQENGIRKVCNIGSDFRGCSATVELLKRYDFFYGAVGIHPTEIDEVKDKKDEILGILRGYAEENERIVAIGEIGLDYHLDDCDDSVKLLQREWFVSQMELARELKLPIVVHSRDAAADTMEVMKECGAEEIGGVIHCYSYSAEMAKQYVNMGFFIGVGGVITFNNGRKLRETVAAIPLEKIVLETDAPYLTPPQNRGKRNSSLNIPYMAERIADIKGIDVETVYEQTYENAHRLYRIDM